jgi:hypothetical protein
MKAIPDFPPGKRDHVEVTWYGNVLGVRHVAHGGFEAYIKLISPMSVNMVQTVYAKPQLDSRVDSIGWTRRIAHEWAVRLFDRDIVTTPWAWKPDGTSESQIGSLTLIIAERTANLSSHWRATIKGYEPTDFEITSADPRPLTEWHLQFREQAETWADRRGWELLFAMRHLTGTDHDVPPWLWHRLRGFPTEWDAMELE